MSVSGVIIEGMQGIVRDDYSNFHPSIFQVGADDKFKKMAVIRQSGKGYTKAEIRQLRDYLQPISKNDDTTLLHYTYFSAKNIKNVQEGLRRIVFKWTGRIIGPQSEIELLNLMSSVFSENSRNVDERNEEKRAVNKHIYMEIIRLNNLAIQIGAPIVVNQVTQYIQAQEVLNNPKRSLLRPENTNITGNKILILREMH